MAGKSYREGVTVMQLAEMFPTEDSAREWFESQIWPNGRVCPHCKSTETIECKGKPPLPYWCPSCKKHFSVRVGTLMHRSKISFRKWVYAIYLHLTQIVIHLNPSDPDVSSIIVATIDQYQCIEPISTCRP